MPGYDAQPVSEDVVKDGMRCRHCKLLLRDPVQTEDGDRLCRSCFEYILQLPDCLCAECGIAVVAGQCYPDKAIRRQVQKLEVLCRYSPEGCEWRGELNLWEEHCTECEYCGAPCPHSGCGESVPSRELEQHKTDCRHRPDSCQHCSASLTFRQLQLHLEQECTAVPVKCSDCDAVLPRGKLSAHRQHDCLVLHCALCPARVSRDSAVELPETNPPVVHLSNAKDTFTHLQTVALKHSNLATEVSSLRTALEGRSKTEVNRDEVSALRKALEALGAKVATNESRLVEELAQFGKKFEKHERREKQMADKLQAYEKEVTKLKKENENLKGKCERNTEAINSNRSTLQPTAQRSRIRADSVEPPESSHNRQMTDVHHRKIEELTLEQVTIKHSVSDLELQLQASLASTHNGSFLWRIPDFSKRRREGIEEKITSIYSPPFYTGRNGYKLCVRAYLNGDGMGYRTHLSLFFVIMRGEYDPLLKWPFDYKVSMILVDQTHRKHIVQTFKPTPESNSFSRPVSDMNVASGCPTFSKLAVFDVPDNDYVKGDVMFVKCIVDTTRIFHP